MPFDVSESHTGFDTLDVVTQECHSHHYSRQRDGTLRYGVEQFRYIWPAECDLMARIAGPRLESRYEGWDATPWAPRPEPAGHR